MASKEASEGAQVSREAAECAKKDREQHPAVAPGLPPVFLTRPSGAAPCGQTAAFSSDCSGKSDSGMGITLGRATTGM